jgi:iron complex transport system ATP-binding protein
MYLSIHKFRRRAEACLSPTILADHSDQSYIQVAAAPTKNWELGTQHPVLSTQHLTIGYHVPRQPPKVVVADIGVTLQAGELVALIGPNGAGKSTLMRTLAGMQPLLAGTITVLGADLGRLKPRDLAQRLSVVLTERVDVGILSAYALVALGRHPYTDWAGHLTSGDETVVRWALDAVGAAHLAGRYVHQLSDGERQKILIARALAQEPALMLLDEPTAFLDLPRRAEIMQMLRRLAHETGRAILLSTHDLDLALRCADTIWLLPTGGPLHVGAPEDLVLSGAFEAAFRSEGVAFDPYTGSFRVPVPPAGEVDLIGEGLPAVWTQRALERAGYCVNRGRTAAIRIQVIEDGNHRHWHLTMNNVNQRCISIYELIHILQHTDALKSV